ncbi:hypothetical protein ID866_10484 [Astraeus odoratus]|nr:hypothetical protein ID866_10484 [Astraeus odoratus]
MSPHITLHQTIQRTGDLSDNVDWDCTAPIAVGGDTLTYRGILRGNGKPVIIKRRRFTTTNDAEALREAYIWSQLDHDNIHPLLGVVTTVDNATFTVAEWMENGNAYDYVHHHNIDPSCLILGIARALAYLHSRKIYHGYVRAFGLQKNVLVASDGSALLTTFCCSLLLPSSEMTIPPPVVGPTRWMAPEGIDDGNEPGTSAEKDVWAFGMTVLELFTRSLPFGDGKSDKAVMVDIMMGRLPERPPVMSNEWWNLCTSCWTTDPALRPDMSTIVNRIEEVDLSTCFASAS